MRKRERPSWVWLACAATVAVLTTTWFTKVAAGSRGLAIVREAERRDTGWGDFDGDVQMTLRNRHGEEAYRSMRVRNLEMPDDGDRILILFKDPSDVKGTALLTYSHRTTADDQWLFVPALRRVKRVSSNNRSGPFMGSEFAYEDLGSQEIGRYEHRFVREDDLDGTPCFVVERTPLDAQSGYSKQIVWIDREHYLFRRVEFFDRKGAPVKDLRMSGYKRYGHFWRPETLDMKNLQNGRSTTTRWSNIHFDNGYTTRNFDKAALRNAR